MARKKIEEKLIEDEKNRLKGIFKDLEENKRELVTPLIEKAAFISVELDILQKTLQKDGWTSEYKNGENQYGTKKSPEAETYVALIKNYTTSTKNIKYDLKKGEKMRLKEIEQRLAAIKEDIEKRATELTAEEIAGYETEVKDLQEERTQLLEQQEKRTKLLASLANNDITDTTSGTVPTIVQSFKEKRTAENPTDTKEYRTAFMNFACRGTAMPLEMRTGENTTVADTGAVIPNTIMQEIIVKMESYGNLYAGFTKLNIQGGVAIPIADIKPVAKWVGENSSEDQKLGANNSIVFNYYGIEVKISQSILVNVTTYEMFQKLFIPLATEAIVKGIEIAAINGEGADGSKMLGVTKDTRVTNIIQEV